MKDETLKKIQSEYQTEKENSAKTKLGELFKKYISEMSNDTNEIYLYIGSCENNTSYVYWNIEKDQNIIIPSTSIEEFQNKHSIIHTGLEPCGMLYMIESVLPSIRTDFLEVAIKQNQEKAKEYIIKRYQPTKK